MPSSPSSSVTEARKALANRLVEIRKGAGLTGPSWLSAADGTRARRPASKTAGPPHQRKTCAPGARLVAPTTRCPT